MLWLFRGASLMRGMWPGWMLSVNGPSAFRVDTCCLAFHLMPSRIAVGGIGSRDIMPAAGQCGSSYLACNVPGGAQT
jgi:hypothetical protein